MQKKEAFLGTNHPKPFAPREGLAIGGRVSRKMPR